MYICCSHKQKITIFEKRIKWDCFTSLSPKTIDLRCTAGRGTLGSVCFDQILWSMVFSKDERAERAPPFILLGTQARIHALAESSEAQGLKWRGQRGGDSSSFHLCLYPSHSSCVSTKATSSVKPSESLQTSPSLPQHPDILLMCSISILHCITNYPQSRQLQTMHIYYLTASVDQESRHGSTGSSAQDFTRLESRDHLGYVFIWRLDWGSIHFYLIRVFGRTHFLWL